jgi:hypothetical protein
MLALVFPHRDRHYWQYATLAVSSPDDVDRWRAAYRQLIRALTVAKRRPLILKSPANTGRIRLLLEMFPDARFVTVHRHPDAVFQSARHARRATLPWWRLQTGDLDEDQLLRDYADLHDAYFDQRAAIPAGRLCEVAFDDLVHDPLATVARIYHTLDLPDVASARPALERYLASLAGYRRNRYRPLSSDDRARVRRAWSRPMREWGYAQSDDDATAPVTSVATCLDDC